MGGDDLMGQTDLNANPALSSSICVEEVLQSLMQQHAPQQPPQSSTSSLMGSLETLRTLLNSHLGKPTFYLPNSTTSTFAFISH